MSKYRLIFGLFLILVGFSSCRPGKVLSRSEMTDVIYDIHITEALTNGNEEPVPVGWLHGMNLEDFRDMAYRSVLRKHKISEATFFTSVEYYSKHLRIYTKIYADVDLRLSRFIGEIKDGKYGESTFEKSLTNQHVDSIKVRKLYDIFLRQPLNVSVIKLYLPADSIPSFIEVKANQWMHKYTIDQTPFSLILIKQVVPAVHSIIPLDTLSNESDMFGVDVPRKPHIGVREAIKSNLTPQ